MRRALMLILFLSAFTFGCGLSADHVQQETAMGYMQRLNTVRQLVLSGRMDEAAREQAYVHALWQHDAKWLNCLIDHHHTRDVNGALSSLATALKQGWRTQALEALDEADDALEEIAYSEQPVWENVL